MTGDPIRTYFLCCTPRSGSAFVAHVFQQTGVLGLVDEFVNTPSSEEWETDPAAYLDWLLAEKTGPNGVFGIKTHFQEFLVLRLSEHFRKFGGPRFLYLERRDRVRQAISLVKAYRRDWWNTVDSDRPPQEHEYDFDEVLRSLDLILDQYRGWDQIFAALDLEVFRFAYEDFVRDPAEITQQAARFLGVKIDPARIRPKSLPVKRQADASSDEWRARFVADAHERLREGSIDCFLDLYPYLRWNYMDRGILDLARDSGQALVYSPSPAPLRREALERLRELGHFDGEALGVMDRRAIEAVVRYQREAGLLVDPRLTPRIARGLREYRGPTRPDLDLSGEWTEETNDAPFGFVTAQHDRGAVHLFCVYVREGQIVSWTARLLPAAGNRIAGTLRHRSDLRGAGWKDAKLDLGIEEGGARLRGTVTPRGGEPSPVSLVRR